MFLLCYQTRISAKIGLHAGGRVVEPHRSFRQRIDVLVYQWVGTVEHLLRCTLGGHLAVRQNNDVVGDGKGLFQLVGDKNAGQTHRIVELADQCGRGANRNRVNTGKRLVIHHQLWVERNGPCQRYAPRHATREGAGHHLAGAPQTHGIELHQHDVMDHFFRQISVFPQRECHVVIHVQVGKQCPKLEQHAHTTAHCIHFSSAHGGDVLAIKQCLTGLGPNLATNQSQNRRFSATGRAHQRGDLATRNA